MEHDLYEDWANFEPPGQDHPGSSENFRSSASWLHAYYVPEIEKLMVETCEVWFG
jgi:hypothetical protein